MADNVSDALKNLDKQIKNADQSLSTMMQRYERFQRAASTGDATKMQQAWNSLQTGANTTAAKLRTLEKEIKNLKAQTKDPASLQRLDKLFRQLNSASGAWASVLASVNRGQQTTQVFAERLARAFEKGQRALSAFNNEQVRGAAASNKMKQGLAGMLPLLQRLGYAFGITFSLQGIVQFGRKLAETRGEFELQQVALRSILQNKQIADDIWQKTMQAALQSPFTAMQLTKYTKQLAAYRIETEKLFDTTKRLADVSAGLGVDMQRLILAYGQVKAANYLRASEIRQFTEAGVNILGELSTYLSKMKGEFVSTAKVMEMVQKRMVTFADVEAIFKRMTDEGGIFYNMQYIQSQTVKGQINKLHDAYDQMLNSIGKANQGTLRNFVATLNSIVQNWRTWAVVIKSIGFGAVIALLAKLTTSLMGVQVAGIAAGRGVTALSKGVKALGVALKANWLTAVIGAVVTLAASLYNLTKKMQAYNDEIDEQNISLFDARRQFTEYQKAIESNNEAIKKNIGSEDDLNKRKKENADILAKLKNDYPQIVDGITMETNGVINLTDALKKENDELERQIALNSLMKQHSIFGEAFGDDADDLVKSYAKMQLKITDVQAEAKKMMIDIEQKNNPLFLTSDLYKALKEFTEIDVSDINAAYNTAEEIYERIKQGPNTPELAELYQNLYYLTPNFYKGLKDDILNIKNEGYTARERQGSIDFKDDEDELKREMGKMDNLVKHYLEQNIRDVEAYRKEIDEKYNGDVWTWWALNVSRVQKDINNGTVDVFRFLRESLEKNGQAQAPGMKLFWNNYIRENYLQPFFDARMQIAPFLGILETPDIFAKKTSGDETRVEETPEEKQGKIDAAWRKRIALVEEMRKRYEELSKSAYGYAKSDKEVRKAFADSFRDVFQGTGISMDQIDFTSMESMMRSFELLKKKATAASKTVRDEIQKKADSSEAKIALDVEVKVREDFSREIEKMFNDYELTLEVQGLNIPKEAMKDLFPDVDVTTLGKLQDRIQKFYQDRQTKDKNGNVLFSEKDLETYRKWANKVDAEILKARKERAKQYSKYLEKEYSERAKLEMQYARDVAFIKANMTDDTQRENILANMQKKYQNDLNELNWKSFKESDFYVEMMDDLASLPRDYMQMMLNKIEEILQHPETLSPRALKEAINARQKVLEAQMSIEPLDVMRSSLATINQAKNEVGGTSWKDTKDKIHEQIASTQQEIEALEEEARCWDATAAAMQVYEDAAEAVTTARGKLSTETQGMVKQQGSANAVTEYQSKITSANAKINELEGKESLTTQEQDQLNALRATVEYYEQQVALLNELIIKEQELATVRSLQAGTDAEQQRGKGGVGTASAARGRAQEARNEANQPKQKIQNLKQYLKAFTNFDAAFAKFNAAINSTLNAVAGMGNAFYDMFDALGGKTDALTEGWKEFGNTMISSITNALTMIPMMVAAFTAAGIAINSAMGIIGLIAEALNLLMTAITAISKLHDAQYEKEIENQQKKIDDLKTAYERLEKAIEKTWTTMAYIDTYNQQVENIKQQIEALEAQRRAEDAKKNTDDDKIKEYNDAIQEAYDELEELEQKRIEVFGGLGEVNYRSAAEEFVSAWKDAFLETGDGLEALQEHFDEFLQEWFVKQATMRIAGAMLERTFRMIDDSVNESSEGGVAVTMAELQAIRDEFAAQAPLISEALEELAGMWDLGNGDGSLSGLAAGIQGMTEEQANILEAYWNSVRMYTANIDGNVECIANILGAGGSAVNPQLQQLQTIAQNTQAIHTLLEGVTKSGHPEGGRGIKVFNN